MIARIIRRHGLDEFFSNHDSLKTFAMLIRAVPARRIAKQHNRGRRLREALQELGPVFVKFGQMLSTRPDLLPEDIAAELVLLQDKVPPFSGAQVKQILEQVYDGDFAEIFSEFEYQAAASASVAQVHHARLKSTREAVIVKVIRPGIEPVIDRDIGLLYAMAGFLQKYWSEGRRLKPVEVVEQFDKTIHDELDLQREAANASQLRANFKGSDIIYVPRVYFDYTRRNIMVMEKIHGTSIRDVDVLKAKGIDMRKLAHDGVEIFFTQAFRDGFFHADMHPGNIFVADNGQYRAVDFGIMGSLSDEDKHYLAVNFLSFFNRDYRGVAKAHVESGWVPPQTRVEEFEAAIRSVCEPIFNKPISEISFGRLVIRLFQTARRFKMPVQPQLVLLQKTLLNIEGIGRQLYPELDLWETAKPYLEKWMKQQYGLPASIAALKREAPKWSVMMPEMPALAHQAMSSLNEYHRANIRTQERLLRLERQLQRSRSRQRWLWLALMILLLAAVINFM